MNSNSFEKFCYRFEIDFQLTLGVLSAVRHFQRYPPINKILVVYYLNASHNSLVKQRDDLGMSILPYSTVPLLLIFSYNHVWPCRRQNRVRHHIFFAQKTCHQQLVLLNVMFAEKDCLKATQLLQKLCPLELFCFVMSITHYNKLLNLFLVSTIVKLHPFWKTKNYCHKLFEHVTTWTFVVFYWKHSFANTTFYCSFFYRTFCVSNL